MTERKMRKLDYLLIGGVLLLAILTYVIYNYFGGAAGAVAVVEVDGETYGSYSLFEEQTIDIVIEGEVCNTLEIKNGEAKMVDADCPDLLCVHESAISKTNETIVCLPHKVVVQIKGGEENEIDSIAK